MARSVSLQVVWFKRDLRVADHGPLAAAAALGPVLPLFIAEPDLWRQPDMSARQWDFAAECLASLREDLAALGQPLIMRTGDAAAVLDEMLAGLGPFTLWSHEETGNGWTYARDRRVKAWAKANSVEWHEIAQSGVVRRLKTRNGWAKRWDRLMASAVHPTPAGLEPLSSLRAGAIPTAGDLGLRVDPCPGRQPGGRAAGEHCLASFLSTRGRPYRRAMSAPEAGAKHCSRLSPHLAWGTLSPKEVAQATWRRQTALKLSGDTSSWTGSLSSFQGRLHWRDHFMQKLEDEPSLEFRNLHKAYDGLRPTEPDHVRLAAWQAGDTGLPFVDACMRALNATGWMNFRMRAMLMAVASYHLWLPWRSSGEHLARAFTDYEAGIHWSQVQMQSGTTGINTIRIYNPVKQGLDQDPAGSFIRRWIPELASVPDTYVHEPWKWDKAGSVLDRDYPYPIVDHLEAARVAREKVWAIRKRKGFRSDAAAIQSKHGSRKAGIPLRGQRKKSAQNDNQLSFLFPADQTKV